MKADIIDLEVYRGKRLMSGTDKEIEKSLNKYEQVLDLLCDLPKPLVIRALQFSLVYLIKFRDLREKQVYP